MGILDPTKVTRLALERRFGIGPAARHWKSMIAQSPKEEEHAHGGGGGGGMGGMGGMDM